MLHARTLTLCGLFVVGSFPVLAQSPTPEPTAAARAPVGAARVPPVTSAHRVQTPPRIDGHLDDAAWANATVVTDFTQRDPAEGTPGSETTEVRIVYDSEAIYVSARLSDRAPVTSRLGRRDMQLASSDWFRVSFDSYHDRRAGFRFDVNPNGVRRDATLSGGATAGGGGGGGGIGGPEGDLAWDAVWDAATSVDEKGWTAELRIPFSQLRFTTADDQTWGVQLERIISRNQEHAQFSFTPKSQPGGVAEFGDLTGLRGIRPGRPLELVPYALSSADFEDAAGNPFRGNRELGGNAGVDARYRLTSSIILSATVNPDFGQVEVDPAIINLSAFEVRLEEKRPFFVEGATNFRFGNIQGPGGSAAALLYSRRIGRPPQMSLGSSADAPGVTSILGAAKVSGKTASGWSLGVLNAVTGKETGRFVSAAGLTERGVVEPAANYFTTRLNREWRRGMTTVGGIMTSVNRDLADAGSRAALRSDAYTGGVDLTHEWANRAWAFGAYVVGSHIGGGTDAIRSAQRSSSRYYQRPDSSALEIDPTATSMDGYAGTLQVRKSSGLHWTGDFWVGAISPGFEINDIGFLQRSDRLATGGALRYAERQPGRIFRNWNVGIVQNHTKNYDGDWIEKILRPSGSATLVNYWSVSFNGNHERTRIDDRLTRGGPNALKPRSWNASFGIDSDSRKSVIGGLDIGLSGDAAGSRTRSVGTSVNVRVSPQWSLTFGPEWTHIEQQAQYVTAVADALKTETFGSRYIFAPLRQTEVSLVTRFNYTFTPDLTLELYLQPLVSNANYGTPKEFLRPSTYAFTDYGTGASTISKTGTRLTVDPDGPGAAAPFSVTDRSFTTRSLRGNAVLRWEYRPGSTMYAVWQQVRSSDELMPDFGVGKAFGSLFDGDSNNVFVLKWTYRFNP